MEATSFTDAFPARFQRALSASGSGSRACSLHAPGVVTHYYLGSQGCHFRTRRRGSSTCARPAPLGRLFPIWCHVASPPPPVLSSTLCSWLSDGSGGLSNLVATPPPPSSAPARVAGSWTGLEAFRIHGLSQPDMQAPHSVCGQSLAEFLRYCFTACRGVPLRAPASVQDGVAGWHQLRFKSGAHLRGDLTASQVT